MSRAGRAKGRSRSGSQHEDDLGASLTSPAQRRGEPSLAVDEPVPVDTSASLKAIEEAKSFREDFAALQAAFKESLEREGALISLVRHTL